jgi:hypothetical protein
VRFGELAWGVVVREGVALRRGVVAPARPGVALRTGVALRDAVAALAFAFEAGASDSGRDVTVELIAGDVGLDVAAPEASTCLDASFEVGCGAAAGCLETDAAVLAGWLFAGAMAAGAAVFLVPGATASAVVGDVVCSTSDGETTVFAPVAGETLRLLAEAAGDGASAGGVLVAGDAPRSAAGAAGFVCGVVGLPAVPFTVSALAGWLFAATTVTAGAVDFLAAAGGAVGEAAAVSCALVSGGGSEGCAPLLAPEAADSVGLGCSDRTDCGVTLPLFGPAAAAGAFAPPVAAVGACLAGVDAVAAGTGAFPAFFGSTLFFGALAAGGVGSDASTLWRATAVRAAISGSSWAARGDSFGAGSW